MTTGPCMSFSGTGLCTRSGRSTVCMVARPTARRILREICAEIDSMLNAGKGAGMPESPGAHIRSKAEKFITDRELGLPDVPSLHVKLQEYALILGVSRLVDQTPGLSRPWNRTPPCLCSGIGAPHHLMQLRASPEFYIKNPLPWHR